MKKLTYVQFKGISFFSKLIRWWTCSEYSHSAVFDPEAPDPAKVLIEQWPHEGGFKSWMDYNYFDTRGGHTVKTPYEIWELPVQAYEYALIMTHYRESAANKKPYDWKGISAFGFKHEDNKKQTFCSEEMCQPVAQILNWDRVNPAVISPGRWTDLLQAAGATCVAKKYIDAHE